MNSTLTNTHCVWFLDIRQLVNHEYCVYVVNQQTKNFYPSWVNNKNSNKNKVPQINYTFGNKPVLIDLAYH